MRSLYFLIFAFGLLYACPLAFAQDAVVSGKVKDAISGEGLPFANIKIEGTSAGGSTDFDGNYTFSTSPGTQTLVFSFTGYKELRKTVELIAGQNAVDFDVEEDNILMDEIKIVADVAISRETPVAFSTIPLATIQEEISVQDLPMVLNATPGVYATQAGGGDGDSEITIRGFNQRNIAIMIDGIPVNDMENGWVYWSNWSGLANVARSVQVQRGLGASKLALPSVGGTINLLTKGIDAKRKFSYKQQIASNQFYQSTISGTTGRLPGGWGLTFTGSYRTRNGWVDQTSSKAWFYFGKIEKQIGKHTFGFSAVGAPQEHAQRRDEELIATYDTDYAQSLGIDTSIYENQVFNQGIRYNKNWGELRRWTIEDGDTIFQKKENLIGTLNYYHKPQFMVKDFWAPSSKFNLSTIAYLSIGKGGGTRTNGSKLSGTDELTGQIPFQEAYNTNSQYGVFEPDGPRKSSNNLISSINNHYWYGLLSTFSYDKNENWNFSGGIDLRYYRGIHYSEVYDLLGGDYTTDPRSERNFLSDPAVTETWFKYVGDRVENDYESKVSWSGFFSQTEYKKGNVSAFINLTGALTGYKRIDYFRPKDLVLSDTTMRQVLSITDKTAQGGPTDSLLYNGVVYTINSPEAQFSETPFKWLPGFTFKTGANWNFSERQNIFFNTGFLRKAPPFGNVFTFQNKLWPKIVYENIIAGEIGYGFKSRKFAANLNSYYTVWLNKPVTATVTPPGEDPERGNVTGMKAHHMGIELDFAYDIIPNKLKWQGLASIGDWRWKTKNSDASVYAVSVEDEFNVAFSANNVYVSRAAQLQFGSSLRYEPINRLYFKLRWSYFGKNYSDYDLTDLTGDFRDRQARKLDDYYYFDLSGGYGFNLKDLRCKLSFNILNLFDEKYIANGTDSGGEDGFNIDRTNVFYGTGRRWSTAFTITF